MSHSGMEPGTTGPRKPVALVAPNYKPRCGCPVGKLFYEEWESSCGGWEDIRYSCDGCGRVWWVEGIDS